MHGSKNDTGNSIQKKLESITGKWWFYVAFVIIQFLIPPYTSRPYEYTRIGEVLGNIFSQALIVYWEIAYPVFKIIPIILIIMLFFYKNRAGRFFSIYAAISYVLFAVLQNIALTDKYGFAVITGNVIMFLIVAASWAWESIYTCTDYTWRKQPWWKFWVVPFALFAFWYPLNVHTMQPDWNPLLILQSSAGLAFCLMTPVYLSVLTIYHPSVNLFTLRITSLVGIIIAFYNMWVNFLMQPQLLWWNGILHIPLLTISIYAFVLSFAKTKRL